MKHNRTIIALVALLVLSVPAMTFAAYVKAEKNLVIDQSASIAQNVYVAGADVTVSSPIDGDLVAAGAIVHVPSQVSQDVLAAGGTVILSGSAQDARVFAGTLLVSGTYGGELMAAGGQIDVTSGTTIAKDSYIAGGSIDFSGTEQGNLVLAGGSVYVNGIVHGNLVVHARQNVRLGAGAVIDGTIDYTSPVVATVDSGAKIAGAVAYHPSPVQEIGHDEARVAPKMALGLAGVLSFAAVLAWIVKFLMVLAAAYVLWFGMRAETEDMAKRSLGQLGKSLLTGFVVLVSLPVAALLACVTVIGAIPAIIGFLVYGLLLVVSMPIAAIAAGSLLFGRRTDLAWYQIALGAFALLAVKLIPFFGWIAWFLMYVAALGAVSQVLWQRWIKKR